MSRDINQKGFTVLELMIASTVFTIILLLCTFGLISIGRVYYKSITNTRTQDVARTIMDDVAQAVQFSGKNPITLATTNGVDGICIDSHRYSFILGVKQNDLARRRTLVADKWDCGAGTLPLDINNDSAVATAVDTREFLAGDMRLVQLLVSPANAAQGLYSVQVKVVSGDYDLLTPTPSNASTPAAANVLCKSGLRGGQFCAVAHISTVVQKRLR